MEIQTGSGEYNSMSTQTLQHWPESNFFLRVLRNLKLRFLSAFISREKFIYSKAGVAMSKVEIEKYSSGKIKLRGALNYDNVMILAHDACEIFAREQDLRVDLEGITYTDSAGIALLVEWLSEVRHQNQEINFINVPQQVMDVARISNLDRVLPMSALASS